MDARVKLFGTATAAAAATASITVPTLLWTARHDADLAPASTAAPVVAVAGLASAWALSSPATGPSRSFPNGGIGYMMLERAGHPPTAVVRAGFAGASIASLASALVACQMVRQQRAAG